MGLGLSFWGGDADPWAKWAASSLKSETIDAAVPIAGDEIVRGLQGGGSVLWARELREAGSECRLMRGAAIFAPATPVSIVGSEKVPGVDVCRS